MHFRTITETDEIWEDVRAYAQACSWRAGAALAASMVDHSFEDWERVAVALDDERICAFCTLPKRTVFRVFHTRLTSAMYSWMKRIAETA